MAKLGDDMIAYSVFFVVIVSAFVWDNIQRYGI